MDKDLSKQEAERRTLKQKESLRETIKMLKLIFEYAKQLKEEKENHEREIGSPVIEFVWEQEYKQLDDIIRILEMHEFML